MSETNQTPAPTVWPTFRARDAHAMINFLTTVFGFRETAVYADGDTVAHAQLSWPEGGGVMLGSYQPNQLLKMEPGTAASYVVSDAVDAIHDRVAASAATIVRELADTDYGSREFSCEDPEGNVWTFGTYRGEPPR